MAGEIILKSFPFDSVDVLNEESSQMEPDREYEAEIFRQYFAKFLTNGVYFGDYKNYKETSMKVSTDGGLTVKVAKGAGIIDGADFENEEERVFSLERPTSGERIDRVIVKLNKTLAVRETQLYIKSGNGSTPASLQRDDNVYEICLAEITVKSTSNLTSEDVVDKRLNKDLCGIVNSLITVDGEELYQKFQAKVEETEEGFEQYINNIKADLALKSEVYKKTETYSKQETYSKEELYPKSNFAIIEFSKDVEVKDAQYPEGFTRDNCIVVSVMRSDYNPKKMWSNTKHCTKQIPNGDNEPITIGWNEPVADVTLYESYIGLSNWDVYYDYRVVLMKV